MLINNQQTEVIWDGKSENGNDVPPGLYFVIIAHEICTVIKQP
jgi:flagellar hook assembly protein FlgD